MTDPNPSSGRIALALRAYGQAAAQVVLAFGGYGLVIFALVAVDSAEVKRVPYGVAALCIGLGLASHAAFGLVRKFPWLLPSNLGKALVEKLHKPLVVAFIVVPLAISWASNETLYGALNPIGYWREQVSRRDDGSCDLMKSTVAHAAEEYQVAANKYNMGIATSAEVKEAVESLKLFSGIHDQCVRTERERRAKAVARLRELEGEGR